MTLIDFQMKHKLKLLKRRTVHILEIQFTFYLVDFLENPFVHQIRKWAATIAGTWMTKMILCNFFILFDLCFSFCSLWDFVWARKLEVICDFPFDNDSLFFQVLCSWRNNGFNQGGTSNCTGIFNWGSWSIFLLSVRSKAGWHGCWFPSLCDHSGNFAPPYNEQMQIKNRSRLGHFLFPVLQAAHLFLVWVLVGSWWYFPWS